MEFWRVCREIDLLAVPSLSCFLPSLLFLGGLAGILRVVPGPLFFEIVVNCFRVVLKKGF